PRGRASSAARAGRWPRAARGRSWPGRAASSSAWARRSTSRGPSCSSPRPGRAPPPPRTAPPAPPCPEPWRCARGPAPPPRRRGHARVVPHPLLDAAAEPRSRLVERAAERRLPQPELIPRRLVAEARAELEQLLTIPPTQDLEALPLAEDPRRDGAGAVAREG